MRLSPVMRARDGSFARRIGRPWEQHRNVSRLNAGRTDGELKFFEMLALPILFFFTRQVSVEETRILSFLRVHAVSDSECLAGEKLPSACF